MILTQFVFFVPRLSLSFLPILSPAAVEVEEGPSKALFFLHPSSVFSVFPF